MKVNRVKIISLGLLASAGLVSPSVAEDYAVGPIDRYCQGVAASLQKQLAGAKPNTEEVTVDLQIQANGDISGVHATKPLASKSQEAKNCEELVQSLHSVDAPPGSKPTWFECRFGKPPESVSVYLRDLDYGPWLPSLQHKIKRMWDPPLEVVKHHETKVVVSYRVHKDGSFSNIKVATPSGFPDLDASGLTAVQKASPVEPLPDGSPQFVDVEFAFDAHPKRPN